jgi:taurine--2-oxoglutarate transaminase
MSPVSSRMSAQEMVALNREYVFFSWSVQSAVNPIPVERAEGIYFWDVDGKRYIDFASQLMNVNTGHQHPRIVQAIKDQADKLCYVYPGLATDVKGELGRLLAEITPGDLHKSFFVLGGAEANDNAIKLTRLYTGRHKIIARYRSYHGATYGAVTLSGDPRRLPVEPTISGVIHVMDPYCYRCPFGWTLETCHRECIDHVEQVIKFEGPENVAAIFLEGVTGSSGIMIYPDEYWPRMREIADRYGILLVDDEVMSGFGRTGEWFGIDNWGVVPDVMTMAKGLTAAYVPLGAVVVSKDIADTFEDRMLPLGLTYSGHPLACATAVATINVYKKDQLIENARAMGKVLGEELEGMKARHPSVGDVRYIGLFSVIEVVKDKETKEPMAPWNAKPSEMGAMADVARFLRDNGLYTFVRWNWIFAVPPLCITESQLKDGLAIIDRALEITDAAAR